tara:strand:- start:1008 stop:2999 length:1992 start_codon:yes stop_codon:yes gene_type:complete
MATGWESFPLELKGGLISNMSRLQQGVKAPGSARKLTNFEPSVKGGYRRINGYAKYDSNAIPSYGYPVVQGSSQTGTTLTIANIFLQIEDGALFEVNGISGTYTVASSSWSFSNKETVLTISPALSGSPMDKAAVVFTNRVNKTEGLHWFSDSTTNSNVALVLRDGSLSTTSGGGYTNVSAPGYGTVRVRHSGQTGSTLDVDGIAVDSIAPRIGDTFSIAGTEKVYTVLATPTVSSGHSTISIYPALASTPADNAILTFIGRSQTGGSKARFQNFNFDGIERVVMVDGSNYPITWNTNEPVNIIDGSTDVEGAEVVSQFHDHLFFAKGSLLSFTAPFTQNDFNTGNGAGSVRLQSRITGLVTFRDKLIIFTNSSIHQLTGTSAASFQLQEIVEDIGCSEPDTIQEVGGDIMFMGPDGLRFLGATTRIGDFNLSLASRNIQDQVTQFRTDYTDIVSLTIRGKSQYRIMGFVAGQTEANAKGFIGTQFADQDANSFSWSETEGIKAYRATSINTGREDVSLIVGETGYVYKLDIGSTFDGSVIPSSLFTPFMSINDPRVRKTMYKATSFYDPEGSVEGSLTFKYDFQRPGVIQPSVSSLNGGGSFSIFGEAVLGTDEYGGNPETVIETNTTGSFFTISLQYEFNAINPPFIVDTVLLEYSNNDRK